MCAFASDLLFQKNQINYYNLWFTSYAISHLNSTNFLK